MNSLDRSSEVVAISCGCILTIGVVARGALVIAANLNGNQLPVGEKVAAR